MFYPACICLDCPYFENGYLWARVTDQFGTRFTVGSFIRVADENELMETDKFYIHIFDEYVFVVEK